MFYVITNDQLGFDIIELALFRNTTVTVSIILDYLKTHIRQSNIKYDGEICS